MEKKIFYIILTILGIIIVRALLYERRKLFLASTERLYHKFIDDQKELNKPEIKSNEKLTKKYSKSYSQLLLRKSTIIKYILDTGIS